MEPQGNRRSFLRLTGLTGIGALLMMFRNARQLPAQWSQAEVAPIKPRRYAGTSRQGDLKEAIGAAVRQVPVPCCDRIVEWTLQEVKGQVGGIDGRNLLTVIIEAHVQ
ncbi:MAG: hypothetical protein JO316_10165 [Abitibacteriaceae bacterium]|nr:hypothetical protein [Abditibacteriaceae bacterium]